MAYPIATLSDGRIRYSDGSIGPAPSTGTPVPQVTPYPSNPTQKNTNPHVVPGTVGVSIPPTSYPNASAPTATGAAGTRYSTGQVVPSSQVLSSPLNLPASNPTPVPTPSNPDPAPTEDTLQSLYERQLNAAREEARRQAGAGYDRARGIYDEGIGLLNKRRGEFQNLFEQGRGNILDRFEQGRGELQASDQGAQTRLANAMRAMGMGGSAYIKSEGANRQNAAKALGGLQTERNNNENANLGEFNSRQDWANTQEGALQRYLEDAKNARSAAESSSDIRYLQDMGNLFDTILSNQFAAKAAAGSYTANPYAVNISDMTKALNGTLPNMTGGEGTVQDVNLKEQDPTLALLKRRPGVAGAGLYA